MGFDSEPIVNAILDGDPTPLEGYSERPDSSAENTTSVSLARVLALGCVTGWVPQDAARVEIWDPTIGEAGAASLLAQALTVCGMSAAVRGQDINARAVERARERLRDVEICEVYASDSLVANNDAQPAADLVIVDPPWGMSWQGVSDAVSKRHERGEFRFGLPPQSDSTWLFISMALERLKAPEQGGGRAAALVNKSLLSSSNPRGADVRRRLLDSGLLESVVRLPEALAPNTAIPLYLMTFTTVPAPRRVGRVQVMDLRTGFTQTGRQRSMTRESLAEFTHNLSLWKPSQRNRIIQAKDFTRRSVRLKRAVDGADPIEWSTTSFLDQEITPAYLDDRYGESAQVELGSDIKESIDLDPGHFFGDDLRELERDLKQKGWDRVRLPAVLQLPVRAVYADVEPGRGESLLWIPTFQGSMVSTRPPELGERQRVVEARIDSSVVNPEFLAAWLNSESGQIARRRAIVAAEPTSTFAHGVSSNEQALMRWADELVMPIPTAEVQTSLARSDEQLRSFATEIARQRESIWADPDSADAAVDLLAQVFDDSIEKWLDQLPFPMATAIWTALTTASLGDRQRALIHAWEAVVAFNATLLLSGLRTDAERSGELERSISSTLSARNMSISRASFGTWVVIIEKLASEIRGVIGRGDADELARLRRSFADLPITSLDRLVAKDLVSLLKEVNVKRNRWLGHSGHVSELEYNAQIEVLTTDLLTLRGLVADAWSRTPLVRAGHLSFRAGEIHQRVEVVVGTRVPFQSTEMIVGEPMDEHQLYLARDGVESPLRLSRFVHLSAAPSGAHFTSYFYNRTEPDGVHLVSYQHGPHAEIHEAFDGFRPEFGSLLSEGDS